MNASPKTEDATKNAKTYLDRIAAFAWKVTDSFPTKKAATLVSE